MTLVRWDPFREFAQIQDRVNRAFSDAYGRGALSADEGLTQAHEQIAHANEEVTQSASNQKATESANGLIERADERLGRDAGVFGQSHHDQLVRAVRSEQQLPERH